MPITTAGKKMNKLINETLKYFSTVKRGDEIITILQDTAPKALRDSVHQAHGDRLPDDWIFDKYVEILERLAEYELTNVDSLEENRAEIVDGLVDVYTSDLTAWLNKDNRNVYYLTEAQEEYGQQEDGFKLLAMAQYMAINEIYSEVVSYLRAQVDAEER